MPSDVKPAPAAPVAVATRGIGIFLWNPATKALTWDDTLAAIFVADRPHESAFQTWERRVHPDDRDRVLATFSEFGDAESLYRLVLDDGSVRHILARATHVVRGPDGEPNGVSGVMLDVTESRRARDRLASMLDSISDGFCVIDRDFRFAYLNRPAERVLGMAFEALDGRDIWQVFPHMLGTVFETSYRKVMTERVHDTFEAYYPQPLNMWLQIRVHPFEDGIVVYFQDVTDQRAALQAAENARAELAHQATRDTLTGLFNRSELERIASERLAGLTGSLTVLFLDLDRFKLVNDTLGHATGDALLVEVGVRLRRVLGPDEVAARLGGDEFVVLLDTQDPGQAQAVAERLLAEIRRPVRAGHYTVSTSASVGLATASASTSLVTLLRNADVALYRAKDAGRDRLAWFDTQAHDELLRRVAMEADLRRALACGGVRVHYQPIFALGDGRLVGVEALARWRHPDDGYISPGVFIPLAEDAGLICRLGSDVLRAAIRQAAHWRHLPGFVVWVNLSGRQLDAPGVATEILTALAEAGVATCRFGVEVTESVLQDEKLAVRELVQLCDAGVSVAIDDFGTGYSSLSRLAALPISVLKIDQSFVASSHLPSGRALLDVTVHLARVLGLRTVAEGIETQAQLELVRGAGVDSAAGYLLGRPAPPRALPTASHLERLRHAAETGQP